MSSSISVSEAREWRRLLRRYAVATAASAAIAAALILFLDPYDTGMLTALPSRGVPDFGQRLAFASLARQAEFDTAVFGNSTIQLLDPARLSALSGRKVVSLAVPGTGPLEQLAIADFFRRQHRGQRQLDLVFGLDPSWCTTADPIPLAYPFPFWLYAPSRLGYAINMMRYKSIEAAWRKAKLLIGRDRAARADGYHDYDTGHVWRVWNTDPAASDDAAEPPLGAGDFTAPPLLRTLMARLDPGTRIILVFVPRHESALPPPGSIAAERLAACKAAYNAVAQARPGTLILDFQRDTAMVRDPENFSGPGPLSPPGRARDRGPARRRARRQRRMSRLPRLSPR